MNNAYLVSLEGWDSFLEAPDTLAGTEDFLRFIVLDHWQFTNDEAGIETFGELSEALNLSCLGDPADVTKADPKTLPARLKDGYVPIPYQPNGAAATWAWLRGPFAPVPAEPVASDAALVHRSDGALVFDHETGAFDVSYALAFQLGRARALSSPAFVAALKSFRDHAHSVYAQLTQIETWIERHSDAVARNWAAELDHLRHELSAPDVPAENKTELREALQSEGVPKSVLDRLERAGTDARVDAANHAMAKAQAADKVLTWLADLALLHEVPFTHLVPESGQLPLEALRFFHVDSNWILYTIDGALSLGVDCAADHAALAGAKPALIKAGSQFVAQRRRFLKGLDGSDTTPGRDVPDGYMTEPKSGFLLRSKLVSSWPGLEIEVTDAQGRACPVIRQDHLGQGVLLMVVEGTLSKVVLKEPSEGLRFGIDDDAAVMLRRRKGAPLGGPFSTGHDEEAKLTGILTDYGKSGAAHGVVDIARLRTDLAKAVAKLDGSDPTDFRSAALSLQLTRSPEEQTIYWGSAAE